MFLGIAGTLVLVSLGVWQVQRLEWKMGILDRIESRIVSESVAIPLNPDPSNDNYLPVMADGRVLHPELAVLLSRKGLGPGFRIIVPFKTEGRRILLDRGFVPERHLEDSRGEEDVSVEGNLLWPDEIDRWFTPEPEGNLWFARDVPSMARELGTEALLIVVRNSTTEVENLFPWPVDTVGIPNDHREYAITWFSLAAAWLGMTAFWLWRIRQSSSRASL